MKKIYLYAGIGGWLVLLFFIFVGIMVSDSSENEITNERRTFQMHEVVTHPISTDDSIAVKVTSASIILDSKTPQTCAFGDCIDDRMPGKYMLTIFMDITNLGNNEYYYGPYEFEIEDIDNKRYVLASRNLGFHISNISKGESYQTQITYDVDIPITEYKLILKQFWGNTETAISLDKLQKFRPALCSGYANCFAGFIDNVVDGNTLDILDIETNKIKRINLSLIDTPEIGENNFENARDFTSGFCPIESYIIFDEDDEQTQGFHDEQIGKLFCEGKLVHEKLLEHELAIIDTQFCKASEFAHESWARNFGCN